MRTAGIILIAIPALLLFFVGLLGVRDAGPFIVGPMLIGLVMIAAATK